MEATPRHAVEISLTASVSTGSMERNMVLALARYRLVALILGVACLLGGCGNLQQSLGPSLVVPDEASRKALLTATADATVTAQVISTAATADERRNARNAFIANRLVLLDAAFAVYLRDLGGDKRTLDSATEGSVLGFSVLGTLRDSARAKENLAAAVALITGLKSNVDKNFFDNRGLQAITTAMVARRREVLARIEENLDEPVENYTLIAARADLNDYEQAATVDGAFRIIQEDAAKRGAEADKALQMNRLVATVSRELGTGVQANKLAMTEALGTPKATLATMTDALRRLGAEEAKLPKTEAEARTALQRLVRRARDDAAVASLRKVFIDAKLLEGP